MCSSDFHWNFDCLRVVTGARLVRQNKTLYIQLQQGKLLPNGEIESKTQSWIPIPDDIREDQKRYITPSEKRFFLSNHTLPYGYVLIGNFILWSHIFWSSEYVLLYLSSLCNNLSILRIVWFFHFRGAICWSSGSISHPYWTKVRLFEWNIITGSDCQNTLSNSESFLSLVNIIYCNYLFILSSSTSC